MKTIISDYRVTQKINEGLKTIIYRGKTKPEDQPVIIKILRNQFPTVEEISRLQHEYEISQNLNLPGIVNPLGMLNYRHGLALILEDSGGESLKSFLGRYSLTSNEFLKIAIQLADTLGKLHECQVIHKDIKPTNIIINPATKEIKITDFSVATQLSKETPTLSNPNLLEGTLAYMSPEQTGRMNRPIDYRTDFYSLGVTFYEILSGQLPFNVTEPMELVHCHIARLPVPLHEVNPEIPRMISLIVMKLLAKNAEERYQSASGLKADLEQCLKQLEETGKISDFILAKLDQSGQLLIPQKLYGREAQVQQLLDAVTRISRGKTEVMLVSGYSGIGKSYLVSEVYKPIVQKRGYFITGKFDQFKRNIPYAALLQAFQELLRQLLTESSEKIELWKNKILYALGQNAQVITEVIPELELLIGSPQNVVMLGATEAQNRFNRVFQDFVHVFCQKEHPLVIFLDDLQWADSASLKLIELLVTDPDSQYLLLIGSYRDNEVSLTHPTWLTLEQIKKTQTVVNHIILEPLSLETVKQLVADTLQETEKSQELAELVFKKTQGNPFFMTHLLQTLHAEKLLRFNFEEGCWRWDVAQIQAIGITDYHVVELVAANIQKLSQKSVEILKFAACIGNQFTLDFLATVSQQSLSKTASDLWPALQAGLILPLTNTYKVPLCCELDEPLTPAFEAVTIAYKFLHDRVQQAAYSLIPEFQRVSTHLQVGQLLLKKTETASLETHIFDIVNQLNLGRTLVQHETGKCELAHLNLMAGQKAKGATAYDVAAKYLQIGLELLPDSSWKTHYDLTLKMYVESVEAEFFNTNLETAQKLSDVVLQNTQNFLEKLPIYEARINFYISQNKMQEAIDVALHILSLIDVTLCESPPQNLIIEDLVHLPEMSDPYQLAALRILMTVATPAYIVNPLLFASIIFTIIDLCIRYGNSAIAAYAYVTYGTILCGTKNDFDQGYQFGKLAVKLVEQFESKGLKSKVYVFFNACIRHWKEPLSQTLELFIEGIKIGTEFGELEYAGYNSLNYAIYQFLSGKPLEIVADNQKKFTALIVSLKQEFHWGIINVWNQLVDSLQNESPHPCHLKGTFFDEDEKLPVLRSANNFTTLFTTYWAKSFLEYLFGNYAQAVEFAQSATNYIGGVVGFVQSAEHNFYYSLSLLAFCDNLEKSEQLQYLELVESNQKQMRLWVKNGPMNYQHKYDLVEAEKAKILGQSLEAMDYYDRAIQGAKEQEYVQEEAIANERAAEFYLAIGRPKIGEVYLREAYYAYNHWGAISKVRNLEAKYPYLFSAALAQDNFEVQISRTTTSTTGGNTAAFDLSTVSKASLVFAEEIVLNKLLAKLLQIVMENAGARTGFLILNKDGQLVLEAKGNIEHDEISVGLSIPVETSDFLPVSLLNYVARTQSDLVLSDALHEGKFTSDPYMIKTQPKSILCMPIINQGQFIGLLYLENQVTLGAFTPQRLEVLKLLSAQAAISLKNALLYDKLETTSEKLRHAKEELEDYSISLEKKVAERTEELQVKNVQLEEQASQLKQAMSELKTTQTQLIQNEKMSSLGQLVAGVAHEINNPINFIYGNLIHAEEYFQDLLQLIDFYEEQLPNPTREIQEFQETIDLDFLNEDVPKRLSSMRVGADRIRQIVLSLRNFSRLDEAEMKPVDIHSGLDSALLILQHRLKETVRHSEIQIVKNYGTLPAVECYAGQLNQAFLNILTNALDALDLASDSQNTLPPQIQIRTELTAENRVMISIADNGPGMSDTIKHRIFDPFFTTKPVGAGTGLGLSISHSIIVQKHAGQLNCISAPGQGAEFIIEIPIRQF